MRNDVLFALQSALSSASLLTRDVSLLAAVSGGADSVALLCGLALLREEAGFTLHTVHVEHGLRGTDSLGDAAFVGELCNRLGVPLLLYHADLAGDVAHDLTNGATNCVDSCMVSDAASNAGNGMTSPGIEARARDARRHFFTEAMETCEADALLTAHHQDDQAETVLMRLLRGSGAQGLTGIRPLTPFGNGKLLRPFLGLPRETLRQALAEIGQPWREDESNQSPCCLRNDLRLTVFPKLNALQPRAVEHMAQTAQRLRWDEDCLSGLAARLLADALCHWPSGSALMRQPLLDAPKAVALRALRIWVKEGMERAGAADGALTALGDAYNPKGMEHGRAVNNASVAHEDAYSSESTKRTGAADGDDTGYNDYPYPGSRGERSLSYLDTLMLYDLAVSGERGSAGDRVGCPMQATYVGAASCRPKQADGGMPGRQDAAPTSASVHAPYFASAKQGIPKLLALIGRPNRVCSIAASGERCSAGDQAGRPYNQGAPVASGQRSIINLPYGLSVLRTDVYLHLCRQNGQPLCPMETPAPVPVIPGQSEYALAMISFSLVPVTSSEPLPTTCSSVQRGEPLESVPTDAHELLPDGRFAVLLTDTLLSRELVLRYPQPGDRIHPFGAPGGKAFRRYLTDRKVDAPFRPAWPVLACGSEVLWAVGIGASEETRLPSSGTGGLWKLSVRTAPTVATRRAVSAITKE